MSKLKQIPPQPGVKIARGFVKARLAHGYGAGLRKMFAQANRARRANGKRMVAA